MERELERYDERIVDERQDSTLGQDVCDFPGTRRNVGLPDRLERVDPLRIFLPDLHDFAEAALPNDLEQIELLDGEGFVAGGLEVDLEMERARAGCRAVPLIGCVLRKSKYQ